MTTTYAQYFDTTSYGWSGACAIHTRTENPSSGVNTMPTLLTVDLREWQGTYSDTVSSSVIMSADFVIPSEEVTTDVMIPFIFHYDLPPGEYMWLIGTHSGSSQDGSFRVYYEVDDYKWPAWLNGASHENYDSYIYGLNTTETYEKAISEGDTFGSLVASDGLDNVQINTPSGYKKAILIHGQRAYVRSSGSKVGRIMGSSHVK